MFTGLIKDIGIIKGISSNTEGKEFVIESNALIDEISIDDSVATNGVCLTATKIEGNAFKCQAIHVTLQKTNLGSLKVNDKVNLELALKASDRLGGHIVQGHVNGTGKILNITKTGKNIDISFSTQNHLHKYIIKEGSIAIDGTSLTIAHIIDNKFTVSLIPHTYENTIFHTKSVNDTVNIEVDIMAKYLEHFTKFENKRASFEQTLKEW